MYIHNSGGWRAGSHGTLIPGSAPWEDPPSQRGREACCMDIHTYEEGDPQRVVPFVVFILDCDFDSS